MWLVCKIAAPPRHRRNAIAWVVGLVLTAVVAISASASQAAERLFARGTKAHHRRRAGADPGRAHSKGRTQTTTISDRLARDHVPAVSVAVINDGRIEWAKAYGLADAVERTPATVDTLFQAASMSKPVTALAALKLVEQGKLDLDEDVNRKLQSWHLPENEFTHKHAVDLRGLLSHTAGLTVHGFPGYAVDAPLPTVPQILDGQSPANTAAVHSQQSARPWVPLLGGRNHDGPTAHVRCDR